MDPSAVSFDFGQTLASLDPTLLASRLRGRGLDVQEARIDAALPHAWEVYDDFVRRGVSGHPWRELMASLLEGAGVPEVQRAELVEWLWTEQPRKNLWRRPVPGMFRLCIDLERARIPFGVLSNSEGRLAELVDEMGWSDVIRVVVDSGRVGLEKPDPRIFRWLAERLGVDAAEVIHVGDSFAADIAGALAAGMRAVWFTKETSLPEGVDPARVKIAHDAAGVRAAIEEHGLPVPVGIDASAWP
jgi:FMN phosphatase YigB (HAD superfamily)